MYKIKVNTLKHTPDTNTSLQGLTVEPAPLPQQPHSLSIRWALDCTEHIHLELCSLELLPDYLLGALGALRKVVPGGSTGTVKARPFSFSPTLDGSG